MATKEIPIAGYEAKLLSRVEVAEGTMAFHFEKPSQFDFKPGQSADVTLFNPPETDSEGNTRTFSIASSPFENQLMFATRMRDTAFKRSLKKVPLGTDVKIDAPMGSFTLHKNSAKPAVFLAGGIGITPFLSIVRQADHDRLPHKLYFFYSNRRPEDAPFLEALQTLERSNPNFPLGLHHERNDDVPEGMEGGDGFDRQRDVVETSDQPAGSHLLCCRPPRHGGGHEENACGCRD